MQEFCAICYLLIANSHPINKHLQAVLIGVTDEGDGGHWLVCVPVGAPKRPAPQSGGAPMALIVLSAVIALVWVLSSARVGQMAERIGHSNLH